MRKNQCSDGDKKAKAAETKRPLNSPVGDSNLAPPNLWSIRKLVHDGDPYLSADHYDVADLPRSVKPFGMHDGKTTMTDSRI
jgi:hypothetical protein